MRPLLALLLSATILGGLALFMRGLDAASAPSETSGPEAALGRFSVDVTTSFSATSDPFALQTAEHDPPAALLVRLNGIDLLRVVDEVTAGEPLTVDHAPGVTTGANEFYLEANPPLDQAERAHAIRLRVLRDGVPLADETVWSEPGAKLAVAIPLVIDAAAAAESKDAHAD